MCKGAESWCARKKGAEGFPRDHGGRTYAGRPPSSLVWVEAASPGRTKASQPGPQLVSGPQ